MSDKTYISRFTPSRTSPEVLEEILVQREEMIADAVTCVTEAVSSGSTHHLLFVGPRGIGKSHIISLIFHRVATDKLLHDQLRIAWLNEDETASSCLDFLLRIYRALASPYPDDFPLDELDSLYELGESAAEQRLGQLIVDKLENHTLLILLENTDRLFEDLGLEGQQRMRAFFQERPVSVIVATSQQLVAGIALRESPFFGFFQVEHLTPLLLSQAIDLLKRIAKHSNKQNLLKFLDSETGNSRVRAIHHLSGGNHRVYIMLSEFITQESLDQLVLAFEQMLDELTPYYQEKLRSLSADQRKLVEFLCRCKRPVPVKEIARQMFDSHQTITSRLRDLRTKGYVTNHPRGRESLYELSEPLMRLCVEIKENRREPIRLIVHFLREWYSSAELSKVFDKKDCSDSSRLYIEAALHDHILDDPQQHMIAPAKERAKSLFNRGLTYVKEGDIERALDSFTTIIDMPDATAKLRAIALSFRGATYGSQGDNERSLADFTTAVETPDAVGEQKAFALFNRGVVYGKAGDTEREIADYTTVCEMAEASAEQKSMALVNRGVTHGEAGDIERAIADFARVIEMSDTSPEQKAKALVNRGVTYGMASDIEKEIADYTVVIEMPEAPAEQKAQSLYNRGVTHGMAGDTRQELADYTTVIEMPEAPAEQKARALFNRGATYGKSGDSEQELADYTTVIEMPGVFAEQKARSLFNRGIAYSMAGDTERALADYTSVIEMPDAPATQVDNAYIGITVGLQHETEYERALEYCERGIAFRNESPELHFLRSELLFVMGNWDVAWRELSTSLNRFPDSNSVNTLVTVIHSILESTTNEDAWKSRVTKLIDIYDTTDRLSDLGKALVLSLNSSPIKGDRFLDWSNIWQSLGGDKVDLQVPLRIFSTGARYLATGDPRVAFDLVAEEREVLADVLDIDLTF